MARLVAPTALAALLLVGLLATAAAASKRAGPDINAPTVQSGFGGAMYVRSVPAEDLGTAGVTEVFRVERGGDVLVDRYPFYLRGALHLAWTPIDGQWCVIQVEPLRLTDDRDWHLSGTLGGLSFSCGGKRVRTYERAELAAMGLVRLVTTLAYQRPGDVLVRGVEQIPTTNDYVLAIDAIGATGARVELRLDIRTGQPLTTR